MHHFYSIIHTFTQQLHNVTNCFLARNKTKLNLLVDFTFKKIKITCPHVLKHIKRKILSGNLAL